MNKRHWGASMGQSQGMVGYILQQKYFFFRKLSFQQQHFICVLHRFRELLF